MCGNEKKSHRENQGDVLNKQLTLQTNKYYNITILSEITKCRKVF